MALTSLVLTRNLKPFSDGSGFEYKIALSETDGEREIRIDDLTASVTIPAQEWPLIRDTVEALLAFSAAQDPRP